MPTIQLENCTKCQKCVRDCPSDAINIESGTINDTCIHCGHCVAICPESTVYPDTGEIKSLNPGAVSPKHFQELSARIRTCRSYLDKKVDEVTLDLLINNMKHYPSASNARPLEICLIKDQETIQKVNHQTASVLIKTLRMITSPVLLPILKVLAPKLGVSRLNAYKKQFIARQTPESSQVCHHAPAVMLFHAPVTKYGMASADAFIWATYTSIYANTLGLGSCFNGFITTAMKRSKVMKTELGIPAGNQVYAALLLGHPKVKYSNEAGRNRPEVKYI